MKETEKRKMVVINCCGNVHCVLLTEDQFRLLDWLDDYEILNNDTVWNVVDTSPQVI